MQYDSSTLIEFLKYLVGAAAGGIAWLVDRRTRIRDLHKQAQEYSLQLKKVRQELDIQKKNTDLDFYEKTIQKQDERLELIWNRLLELENMNLKRQKSIAELLEQNEQYKSKIQDLEDLIRGMKDEIEHMTQRLIQHEPNFQPTTKRKTKAA